LQVALCSAADGGWYSFGAWWLLPAVCAALPAILLFSTCRKFAWTSGGWAGVAAAGCSENLFQVATAASSARRVFADYSAGAIVFFALPVCISVAPFIPYAVGKASRSDRRMVERGGNMARICHS